MEEQKGCIRVCEVFEYLGVKINQDRKEKDANDRIYRGRAKTARLNGELWNRQIIRKNYKYIIQHTVLYGADT